MSDKIERQKIFEREPFTYEEKMSIAKKSDMKCCRCGKVVYPDFGGTVEHFIPISKGGTNRDVNLIWMCKDCNKEKGNRIIYPNEYISFLEEEHRDKLWEYFKSYAQSFEYIDKNNFLCCDLYGARIKLTKNQPSEKTAVHYIKKALRYNEEEYNKLLSYLKKYFKKHNIKENAKETLDRYFNEGCVYYVENKEGVNLLIPVSAVLEKDIHYDSFHCEHPYIKILMFPYYQNERAATLLFGVAECIPMYIIREQELSNLTVLYGTVKTDKLGNLFMLESFTNERPYSGKGHLMQYGFLDFCIKGKTEKYGEREKEFFDKIGEKNG